MAQPLSQPQPQPQPQKAFPVGWDQFHRDARALAWRLAGAGPFQAIVCVTRGGLVPAAIVARELGIRLIETVCVASYNHVLQGELKVLKDVAGTIVEIGGGRGKGVLIVDDLVDTGKTAKSNGFIDILTLPSSTPEPSALTRIFTSLSTARLTGTRIFMALKDLAGDGGFSCFRLRSRRFQHKRPCCGAGTYRPQSLRSTCQLMLVPCAGAVPGSVHSNSRTPAGRIITNRMAPVIKPPTCAQ